MSERLRLFFKPYSLYLLQKLKLVSDNKNGRKKNMLMIIDFNSFPKVFVLNLTATDHPNSIQFQAILLSDSY